MGQNDFAPLSLALSPVLSGQLFWSEAEAPHFSTGNLKHAVALMSALSRRTIYYLCILLGTTVLFTGAYSVGMSVWEGRPRPWYRALEVVVQTFTTTGYGEDAPWTSPQMNVLVVVMQLTGIGFILSAVDVFVVPWLQRALQPSAPSALSDRVGHVVVCGYTPRVEVFIEHMEARGQEYVLIEADGERAGQLYEQGEQVIEGDATVPEVLERAHAGSARAIVADVADDENASIVLAAREVAPDGRIITLAEDASLARYHRAAGADVALSPRQLVGRSLAARVPVAAAANVEASVADDDDIELAELVVTPHSPLYRRTLDAVDLEEQFGVRVIGAWVDHTFETTLSPDTTLDDTVRLFVAGTPTAMSALQTDLAPYVRPFAPQSILLAGYGDSGRAAAEVLRDTQAMVTVLDVENRDGVDVQGDVRDPEALREAGIESASVLIIAVDDDTVATFATLIAHDLNPELQILVRAQEEDAVQKLHRAGADFVQALPTVCGRMLAATVLEDERPSAPDRHIRVERFPADGLEDSALADVLADVQSNYSVLAVVRDDAFRTVTAADAFVFERGDEVIVAGTDDGLQQFRARVGDRS